MKIIKTNKAPEAIGPYSQAVIANNFIFTSGQIGTDPVTGKIVNKDIRSEIMQIIKNLESILVGANSSVSKIVKLNVYLKNLNDFEILNNVFEDFFNKESYPARSTFEVSNLPKNANVEIDAIAIVREGDFNLHEELMANDLL